MESTPFDYLTFDQVSCDYLKSTKDTPSIRFQEIMDNLAIYKWRYNVWEEFLRKLNNMLMDKDRIWALHRDELKKFKIEAKG